MRIVLDTNVFISAFVYRGKPERLLQMMLLDTYTLITSEAIVRELESVLLGKFAWRRAKPLRLCEASGGRRRSFGCS